MGYNTTTAMRNAATNVASLIQTCAGTQVGVHEGPGYDRGAGHMVLRRTRRTYVPTCKSKSKAKAKQKQKQKPKSKTQHTPHCMCNAVHTPHALLDPIHAMQTALLAPSIPCRYAWPFLFRGDYLTFEFLSHSSLVLQLHLLPENRTPAPTAQTLRCHQLPATR